MKQSGFIRFKLLSFTLMQIIYFSKQIQSFPTSFNSASSRLTNEEAISCKNLSDMYKSKSLFQIIGLSSILAQKSLSYKFAYARKFNVQSSYFIEKETQYPPVSLPDMPTNFDKSALLNLNEEIILRKKVLAKSLKDLLEILQQAIFDESEAIQHFSFETEFNEILSEGLNLFCMANQADSSSVELASLTLAPTSESDMRDVERFTRDYLLFRDISHVTEWFFNGLRPLEDLFSSSDNYKCLSEKITQVPAPLLSNDNSIESNYLEHSNLKVSEHFDEDEYFIENTSQNAYQNFIDVPEDNDNNNNKKIMSNQEIRKFIANNKNPFKHSFEYGNFVDLDEAIKYFLEDELFHKNSDNLKNSRYKDKIGDNRKILARDNYYELMNMLLNRRDKLKGRKKSVNKSSAQKNILRNLIKRMSYADYESDGP